MGKLTQLFQARSVLLRRNWCTVKHLYQLECGTPILNSRFYGEKKCDGKNEEDSESKGNSKDKVKGKDKKTNGKKTGGGGGGGGGGEGAVSCGAKGSLKALLAKKIPEERERMIAMKKSYGKKTLGEIKLDNVFGGMRGLRLLMCNTSYVDPKEGIFYQNHSLQEVVQELPRYKESEEGMPEGCFWLLMSGEMPEEDDSNLIACEWSARGKLPKFINKVLESMDKKIHPMTQFVAVTALLSANSEFVKAYNKGIKKPKYWEYTYEDAMNLCAYIISYAAIIYGNVFKGGNKNINELDPKADWSLNFSRMLGLDEPGFVDLMRLYMVLHADHEGGNVSAHTTSLVGSALSDPYLSFAAGLAGLAGPLHGLANQEVVLWLEEMKKSIGDEPDDEEIIDFINDTLKRGKVVPGYGHAVLRETDPRYVIQAEFAKNNCPDDVNVKLVSRLYEIIPEILKKLGKVQNPYPNVDAHSGVLLQHYGLKEMSYYTVLFGVSRALGCMSQLVWSRALGAPLERPKSFTTKHLCQMVNK